MDQELKNPFGRVYITVKEDTLNKWIEVVWMGYLTVDNVKKGAELYTQALSEAGYNCVLNDSRLVLGSWDHSLEWVVNEWAPAAARAGLKHFAIITTPETFADSTAVAFYSQIKDFEVQVFDDIEQAKAWLKSYSQAEK